MPKFIQTIIFLSFLFLPSISIAEDLPEFFKIIKQEAFFPNGINEWKLQKNTKGENYFLLQWENPFKHEITLKYRDATSNTIQAVFQGMGEEIDKSIKEVGGTMVTLNDFFAVILINDTQWNHSLNLLYGTPEGAYHWKYKVPRTFETNFDDYIASITSVSRKHQYDVATKYGNIVMGRWGGPVHEFAKLLAGKNDPRTKDVYKHLLQTNPSNYDAQIEYTTITKDKDEADQSAIIDERDAEEESLLNAAAKILNKDIPASSSYPLLETKDKGIEVILIPFEPCNPWLLDEIAKTYEKITSIPVVIRRLPVNWTPPEPSRSAYRPYLEKIASNIWKTKSDFSDWSLSKLKDEIMNKAKEEGPQAVTSISRLFKKMDEAGYQWDAVPIMNWLSQAITPYYSRDPNTMVVGITELDIFLEESNFVFSVFGGHKDYPVSILSYAKMRAKLTGESQSRKRLTERAAKELVPASLKKLNIPRSIDPACPYSYSSGLQRLEEKALNLSEPVKREIEKIKNSI
jgi:predicted Zn-dependent protease